MATYSIDDSQGNCWAAGLPKRVARKTARGLADERGESMWLYRDSEGAQAFDAEEIKPPVRP